MYKLLRLAIILLMLMTMTSCFSPVNNASHLDISPQKVEESIVLHVLTNRVDLVDNGELQRYAKLFNERYPDVTIKFEGLSNYVSDIMGRLSTQSYGDVLLIPNNLKNEDLQYYFSELPTEIFEGIRFADHKSFHGKHYGIASGASSTGIVYNKLAFEKAGIESIPTTLEQFYEACEKLKQAGFTPIFLNYGAEWPLMNWGEELVSIMNGDPDYLNNMIYSDTPWEVDNEWGSTIKIVKYLIENQFVEENLLSNQWESSKVKFVNGEVGMFMLGNWVISQLIALGAEPEEIGFFPFPYRNEQPIYSLLSPDWFIGVSKYSKHQEMSQKWIQFFVKESGYIDDSGFLPVSIQDEPPLLQYQEFVSFGSIPVERKISTDQFLEIADRADIRLWSGEFTQEWIASDHLQDTFDSYNLRWQEAKRLIEY